MFRSLHDSIARLEDKSGIDVERAKFNGYDGNNESQHYAFAEFVLKKRNHYGESRNEKDYNTHGESLPAYRRMLAVWRGFQKRGAESLTRDEILQVVTAGGPLVFARAIGASLHEGCDRRRRDALSARFDRRHARGLSW